jgi:hypothetical protein
MRDLRKGRLRHVNRCRSSNPEVTWPRGEREVHQHERPAQTRKVVDAALCGLSPGWILEFAPEAHPSFAGHRTSGRRFRPYERPLWSNARLDSDGPLVAQCPEVADRSRERHVALTPARLAMSGDQDLSRVISSNFSAW